MKRRKLQVRAAGMTLLVMLSVLGIGILALLTLLPQRVLANLVGEHPVSIRSALRADYSADDRSLVIAPLDMRIVEEVIRDRIAMQTRPTWRLTTLMAQAATASALPGWGSLTATRLAGATNGRGGATATETMLFTATLNPGEILLSLTPSPGVILLSLTPNPTLLWTSTPWFFASATPLPTATGGIILPATPTSGVIYSPTPTSQKASPTLTATSTPYPPTNTPLPSLTNTPIPTKTPTPNGYPPPSTPIPTVPPTPYP